MQYIAQESFLRLLNELGKEYDVFVPVQKNDRLVYTRYSVSETPVIGEVRPVDPLKLFYTRAREMVAEGFGDVLPGMSHKPYCIVGAKACDLKGFTVQDFVFRQGDFTDPFYVRAREDNLVITADCTCALDTCFCLAMGVDPYPSEGFDINLSEVSQGYTVEPGSDRGREIMNKHAGLFAEATESHSAERVAVRKRVAAEVRKGIRKSNVPSQDDFKGMVRRNFDSGIWKEEAGKCVECGACNSICPTCHCFLLYDQKNGETMERLRVWDSCMIKDFALVAAGVNPREHLWMRLRNRFEKKFDFFHSLAGVYACTGCGRCVSACPADIDIRKVLQRLVEDVRK